MSFGGAWALRDAVAVVWGEGSEVCDSSSTSDRGIGLKKGFVLVRRKEGARVGGPNREATEARRLALIAAVFKHSWPHGSEYP